jgi:hypothetical protein
MQTRLFLFLALCAFSAQAGTGPANDGVVPANSKILTLARLPESTNNPPPCSAVRLAPSGKPMALYHGRLIVLSEQTNQPPADWQPPMKTGGSLRDFCWLDGKTLVLLQETQLSFIRGGLCVTNFTLPFKEMRLARADASHCYLFGGKNVGGHNDVLRLGLDGTVTNLFRAPQPVTAVAGDGDNVFAAVGDAVFFLSGTNAPRAVFREHSTITDLAIGAPGGIFYATEDGVGCLNGPKSGLMFLQQKIASLDSRANRLLILTAEREVLLIEPTTGFPQLVQAVQKFLKEKSQPENAGK